MTVVGSVNYDTVYRLSGLPQPGQTRLTDTTMTGPGGKGGNQAVAAARAGAEVELVAAVGDDAHGVYLRAHLEANGIGTAGLTTLPLPTGTAVILVDDRSGENMIVVAAGANGHLNLDAATLRTLIADCDVLLVQLEIPLDTALAAARGARAAGATVMLNASPLDDAILDRPELAELAATVDVVVVNEGEAAQWRWPAPHLVTTRGSRGAHYTGVDGEFDVASPAVEAADTSGAGDVFAGVLAAGWSTGPRRALRRACAAGALATLVEGAGDCAPTDEAITDVLGD